MNPQHILINSRIVVHIFFLVLLGLIFSCGQTGGPGNNENGSGKTDTATINNVNGKETNREIREKKKNNRKKKPSEQRELNPETDIIEFAFRGLGKVIQGEVEQNLLNDAVNEVSLERLDRCKDSNCGKKIYLINTNPDKTIAAIVRTNWNFDGKTSTDFREYNIAPDKSLMIGCSRWCVNDDKIKFKRVIVSAEYR